MTAPPPIRQLSEQVANQIAAGEVVERPGAAVKELVENALDAGAHRITVRMEDGGRRLIEVEDDGHGMRPEDLRLALRRHATSKIASADDLFRVSSLGFRGEALPSIAAVSEFEIASRPHAATGGQRLVLAGGQETGFGPCAMAAGTRITVRNLFFNVPARLKFLKSEQSEAGHINDQVLRLALAHPAVAFRLESGGQVLLERPPGETLVARLAGIFGQPFAQALLPVARERPGLSLIGFIAHPRDARPTGRRQFTWLNGRYLRDRLVIAALREGYAGYCEPRLHPSAFLHLQIDPALVDVNVHPQKAEVRFRREGEVFALVREALQEVLAEHRGGFSLLTPEDRARLGPGSAAPPSPTVPVAPPQVIIQERFLPLAAEGPTGPRVQEHQPHYGPPARSAPAQVTDSHPSSGPTDHRAPTTDLPPGFRRVLQLNDTFLLIESDAGIRLVDQHALHEKAIWLQLAGGIPAEGRQELLLPRPVELGAVEVAALAPLLPRLLEYGIEAEVFGPTSVLVRSHPPALRRIDWAAFFAALLADGPAAALAHLGERLRHAAACHAAVKKGQRLSHEEQLELVRLLHRLDDLEHCPHGRPTVLDLSWSDLERRFNR